MRIVIDLQGAQSIGSRNRGIGRYALSLSKAIIKNRGDHEVIIALSNLFPDTIESIREYFEGHLSQKNIRIWTALGPVGSNDCTNTWRRKFGEILREAFFASLKPDVVLISSLFEGLGDDVITSIGMFSQSIATAVVLFDIIPFIYPQIYLENQIVRDWYLRKIDHIKRADLCLSISDSSRKDGIDYLGLPEEQVINISTSADSCFHIISISEDDKKRICHKYGLTKPFLMYTGGIDRRKNINRLIGAFARLPKDIRQAHQLAIVCSVKPDDLQQLEHLARREDLGPDEVIFTGYVPEDDLIALYNLCTLFVFPSWYEGFGLPALEAMCCGAPVIAANTSSLPEVIGRIDALFDPFSENAIAAKILEVLTNKTLREDLSLNGLNQAKKFSWDTSAKIAISALEQLHRRRQFSGNKKRLPMRRPKLAYLSPLPPERSGIADYSSELLPELSKYYDIEVVATQLGISDSWINACLPIRSVEWFFEHANRYDRILYHFGNSAFHEHMFELLERFPGAVVLHDFFLSGAQAHREMSNISARQWVHSLYESHGYIAVKERFHISDMDSVILKYPCNFGILQHSLGVIVHSEYSIRLASEWYGNDAGSDWVIIPHLRIPVIGADKHAARKKLGLSPNDFIICSFGLLGPLKQNHRLLKAWMDSKLAFDSNCQLIFVGENDCCDYGRQLENIISRSSLRNRIHITGWVDSEKYKDYLAAADVAVQLRMQSRGETSGTVLDCMNYGLAIIANAHGSLAELPQNSLYILKDNFKDKELVEGLEALRADDAKRINLGLRARQEIMNRHAPRVCANNYANAIEAFYFDAETGKNKLISELTKLDNWPNDDETVLAQAVAIAQDFPQKQSSHQILLDISELVQMDAKTGIQRVTRSILNELLCNPPKGYRVEPVYSASESRGYRYARKFTFAFLQIPECCLTDDLIEANPGDIFLEMEFRPIEQVTYLDSLHQHGVNIYFLLYDMLPIFLENDFPEWMKTVYTNFLNVMVKFDGVVCISRTVADEFYEWLVANNPKRLLPFNVGWFHLGADIKNSVPTRGLPDNATDILVHLSVRPSFLIVGTIEPRKGHLQIIAAFDQLLNQGEDINLIIVGKVGWKDLPNEMRKTIPMITDIILNHSELNKRLFWLQGISDEFLEKLYGAATCLVVASEGEGFCLPLIEAAQHKLPLIVRDIPIFKEVAGAHAFYFKGAEPADLAKALQKWMELYKSGLHPMSNDILWSTWKESTQQLLEIILGENWYAKWMPEKV